MRKAVVVVGSVVGAIVLLVAAVFLYAVWNLDSIVAERRGDLLARLSHALDRKVEVGDIKVTLGWGLMADLRAVKIADDPAISDQPFVEASDVYAAVNLIPLLTRRLVVTQVTIEHPEMRIIRTEQGTFNVTTIGNKSSRSGAHRPPGERNRSAIEANPLAAQSENRRRRAHNLGAFKVKSLTLDGGRIIYEERGPRPQTITIENLNLAVENFSFERAFDLTLTMAAFSDRPNADVSGSIGPLARTGEVDIPDAPFNLEAKLGPLALARLNALALGKSIPDKLSMPDPLNLEATANGTLDAFEFHVESDLTSDRIAWGESFGKPAAMTLRLTAAGSRSASALEITQASVQLGDLEANVRKIDFGHRYLSATIDTNRFDIGSLARMLPALQKYSAAGQMEVNGDLILRNNLPQANGTLSFFKVSLSRPGDHKALIDNLAGEVRLKGRRRRRRPAQIRSRRGPCDAHRRCPLDAVQCDLRFRCRQPNTRGLCAQPSGRGASEQPRHQRIGIADAAAIGTGQRVVERG